MDAKLTLKLNKETIKKAKKYAEENNISLSRLIEKQLDALVGNEESVDAETFSIEVNDLIGILKPTA
jgi:hypothetical protein